MKAKKEFATAYVMTPSDTYRPVKLASLTDMGAEGQAVWVHLDLSDKRAGQWLKKQPQIPQWARQNLMSAELCEPRLRVRQNQIFLVLRTINMTPGAEPDDLVFLRLYATENILITASSMPVLNWEDIDEVFLEDIPQSSAALLPILFEQTLDGVSDSIANIEQMVDDYEEAIITNRFQDTVYAALSELLRQVIIIRRFMLPEREVLDNLMRHGIAWFTDETNRRIRDDFDRIRRIVEDIDLLEKRIRVNQDALTHMEDRRNQRNTYMLSVIAGIFLPLSFLASVFGMNLGGIPGNSDSYGFVVVTAIMCLIGIVIWFLFKHLKWV